MSGLTRKPPTDTDSRATNAPSRLFRVALLPLLAIAAWVPLLAIGAAVIVATPCATEDSSWCRWDADHRGNGTGQSFIVIGDADAPIIIRY